LFSLDSLKNARWVRSCPGKNCAAKRTKGWAIQVPEIVIEENTDMPLLVLELWVKRRSDAERFYSAARDKPNTNDENLGAHASK
jgi:hypothetical protein